MSKAMQLLGIIMLGIFTLAIIYLMSDARSTSELDYYLLQEVTEASMYDAVDYSFYRDSGQIKVDRDMFLESFNRRFAQSVAKNREYDIKIIDFNETPPKVSIEVRTNTIASVKGETAEIVTRVSGIIETIYDDYIYARGLGAEASGDTAPPTITLTLQENGTYKILISDNFVLDSYAIQTFNGLVNFKKTDFQRVTNWQEISDYKSEYTLNNIQGGAGMFIIAKDQAGNMRAEPLFDSPPWVKDITYASEGGKTKVTATLYDDRGIDAYYLIPANVDVFGNTVSVNKAQNYAYASVKSDNKTDDSGKKYYEILNKEFTGIPSGWYILGVRDTAGNVSEDTQVLIINDTTVQSLYSLIGSYYRNILGRAGASYEIFSHINAFKNANLGSRIEKFTYLANAFTLSDEFMKRLDNIKSEDLVEMMYKIYLGRPSDEAGKADNIKTYEDTCKPLGSKVEAMKCLINAFTGSPEYPKYVEKDELNFLD